MKKFIYSISLALLISIGSSSCDTCDIIVLADLVARSLLLPQTISVGDILFATAEVANERDDNACNTSTASSTVYLHQLFKKNDNTDEWDMLNADEESQAEIESGDFQQQSLPFEIVGTGTYRIDYLTDSPDIVEERNEINNDESGELSKASHNRPSAAIPDSMKETNNFISVTFEVVMLTDSTAEVIVLE